MEGPELAVIETERLGFSPLADESKVQLTPAWLPPPAPTSSLLAIASRKGIVAAGGPDAIYISTTDSVRTAFNNPKDGDSEVRPFDAQVKIPMPIRLTHIAFTPDEQYLILSAEQGGGLAVYETQTLLQSNAQSALEISTNGETVKFLVPNPMPELAEFCAIVTTSGNLLMANFKESKLISGPNGPVLRAGVTSIGWSTKGKQLVAGLADGSIMQMTPDGTEKFLIPKPNSLGDFQVASVSWLENHLFLAIYNNAADVGECKYFVITRSAPPRQEPSYEFRKLGQNPVEPYGNEAPPHHTILRLREYPPAIQELLIATSSASDGLGLLTKAKDSLAVDGFPPEEVTNVFTTTEFTDDSRRAQLPTDENYDTTTPIGVALDLSSKDKVYKPVAGDDEIEFSPGPLPGAWVLNNCGVLCAWWVVYYDAVRQGETYSGFSALQGEVATQPAASAPPKSALPTTTAFGSKPASNPFGAPTFSAPALTNPSPALGNPFGAPAAAAVGPSFGTPAFGSASALGAKPPAPAFGQHGGLGTKVSPWASGAAGAAPAAPAMNKVFGTGAAPAAPITGSGFSGLAGQSGFAGLGGNNGGDSIFAKPASSSPFGAATGGQSAFGGSSNSSAFGSTTGAGAFGKPPSAGTAFGGSPFVLGTTFKADPISANDNEEPSGKGGFGLGGFGLSLEGASSKSAETTESKDENMDAATPSEQAKPKSIFDLSLDSTKPTATTTSPKLSSSGIANPFGAPSSLFGSTKPQAEAPKESLFARTDNKPKDNPFGQIDSKPKVAPSPFGSLFGGSSEKPSALKSSATNSKADPPLPPDTMSKASYPFGGSSSSSSVASAKTTEESEKHDEPVEDAPLPPDFVAPKRLKPEPDMAPPPLPLENSPVAEDAPLPPDFTAKPKAGSKSSFFDKPIAPQGPDSSDDLSEGFDSDEDEDGENEDEDDDGEDEDEDQDDRSEAEEQEDGSEGSGTDVAKDVSPRSIGASHDPGRTPQSSFGGMGGSAFLVARPDVAQPPRSSMFGATAPVLAKPKATSPRSPSPDRSALPSRLFPVDGSRSVSAPSGAIRPQVPNYSKSVSSRLEPRENPNVALQKEALKKQAEQQEQSLEDDEYEHVQANLERPVSPTLDIGDFTAYTSVTADALASTVAAQVEALYRDMNGMLLTLGTNARALRAFVNGHEQRQSDETKTTDDLGNADDWVLCEAEDLGYILEDELAPELQDARVQDVQDTWDTCQDLVRELPRLRAKKADLKRILDSILDPDQADAARQQPLSEEQNAQQNALRQGYARVTKLMADAESRLALLRTKLSSFAGTRAAQPTVEAIMRTIGRMTSAAEKRSGDIDILESQMRQLRMSGSVPASTSREGTPEASFRTPTTPNKRNSLSRSTLMSGSGFSPSPMRSMNGSASRNGPSPRKPIGMFTAGEKDEIRLKTEKRQAVLDRLRGKMLENGPKVSRMG